MAGELAQALGVIKDALRKNIERLRGVCKQTQELSDESVEFLKNARRVAFSEVQTWDAGSARFSVNGAYVQEIKKVLSELDEAYGNVQRELAKDVRETSALIRVIVRVNTAIATVKATLELAEEYVAGKSEAKQQEYGKQLRGFYQQLADTIATNVELMQRAVEASKPQRILKGKPDKTPVDDITPIAKPDPSGYGTIGSPTPAAPSINSRSEEEDRKSSCCGCFATLFRSKRRDSDSDHEPTLPQSEQYQRLG